MEPSQATTLELLQQLSTAAGLSHQDSGAAEGLLHVFCQSLAVATQLPAAETYPALPSRVLCCQLLQQLLDLPVPDGALQQQQQPQDYHQQQQLPPATCQHSSQVLLRQVLAQLPALPAQHQQEQHHKQQQQHSACNSAASSNVWAFMQQHRPGSSTRYLQQLLGAAAQWVQAAVKGEAAAAAADKQKQTPAHHCWVESQEWLLSRQLLQLATSVAAAQVAQQQQPAHADTGSSNTKEHEQEPAQQMEQALQQLLTELMQASTTAASLQEQDDRSRCMAALWTAAEPVHLLLQPCLHLGLLSTESACRLRHSLVGLVMGGCLDDVSHLATAAAAEADSSSSSGSGCCDVLGWLLSPQAVLQSAAAAAALQQIGLQDWHTLRLQLLVNLLQQQDDGGVSTPSSSSKPWNELSALLVSSKVAGSSGSTNHLVLLLVVLHAVAGLGGDAGAEAGQGAGNETRQHGVQHMHSEGSSELEPDYFHDIFGSEEGTPDDALACIASAAAVGAAGCATLSAEQLLLQLAAILCQGLSNHLDSMTAAQSEPSSSSSPQSWTDQNDLAVKAAICFVGTRLPIQDQQQQPDLAAIQQRMQLTLQQLCTTCIPAALQLQQVVLLGRVSPADSGHSRHRTVMQLAAQVMLQHIAMAAATVSESIQTTAAAAADPRWTLLRMPWVHLADGLIQITAGVSETAAACGGGSNSSSSSSLQQLQQSLVWLLSPGRLAVLLASALAVPAGERATLAAVMLHCMSRCVSGLGAAAAAAAAAGATPTAGAESGASERPSGQSSSEEGVPSPHVGAEALILSALHACLSVLLWLVLPADVLPTAWMQQQLQSIVQQPDEASSEGHEQQQQQQTVLWPVALPWVNALLQYRRSTDELPLLLQSLGLCADRQQQQVDVMYDLLPGMLPSCLPELASDQTAAAVQKAVQQMQLQEVQEAGLLLLQQQTAHSSPGSTATGCWGTPSSAHEAGVHVRTVAGAGASITAHGMVEHFLDQVLPAAAGAWSVKGATSGDSGWNLATTLAFSSCQQRALQLLVVLQQAQHSNQCEQHQQLQDAHISNAGAAGSFNKFGSYQQLVQLPQRMAQLYATYYAELQSSSSVWVPSHMPLHASVITTQQLEEKQQQQELGPRASAAADALGKLLLSSLDDAVHKLKLCGASAGVAMLLKQQLHSCCAEIELLGLVLKASNNLLASWLPKLLPKLAQLQLQLTSLQLNYLAAAIGSRNTSTSSNSNSSTTAGDADTAVQLLLALCTDADNAADELDAVHEGLGYCLLACLTEPQGQCWPSRDQPAATLASAATTAAEADASLSSVDASSAQSLAQMVHASSEAQVQQQGPGDWGMLVQQLNMLHSCMPPAPLPELWWLSSFNRAAGSLVAAGAAMVAAAATGPAANVQEGEQQASLHPPAEESCKATEQLLAAATEAAASSEALEPPTAAAVASWLHQMVLLDLRWPLLTRSLQQQHTHLLQPAAAATRHPDALLSSSSDASGTAAEPQAAAAAITALSEAVHGVVAEVSAALSWAAEAAAAATAAKREDGQEGAPSLSMARSVASAAVMRLQDAAEGCGSDYGAVLYGSSPRDSIAGQLVAALIAQQQPESVLLQLWQGLAAGVLETWRVVELGQQLAGLCQGSEDAHMQQLHEQLLQLMRSSLLQLPPQQFEQLLMQQLKLKNGFAPSGVAVCRELWQQLLAPEDTSSTSSSNAVAVQLLEQLLAACLRLCFQLPGKSPADGQKKPDREWTHSAGLLLAVAVQCATALGQPGLLVCLQAVRQLAQACAAAAAVAPQDNSSSSDSLDPGQQCVDVVVIERLSIFLPLLLFVQRVLARATCSSSRSSSGGRPGSFRAAKKQSSSASSATSSRGQHSDADEAEGTIDGGTDHEGMYTEEPEQQQQQHQGPAAGARGSGTSLPQASSSGGTVVVQDDMVQVLGVAGASGDYDEDEFLDEFEDDDAEYLAQLIQHGAAAAAADAGDGSGLGAATESGGRAATAADGAAQEDDYDEEEEEDMLLDDDEDYHDATDGLQPEGSSRDSDTADGAEALAPTGAAAVNTAVAAAAAAPRAMHPDPEATAAAAAVAAALHGAAAEDDEDEQALLDEEFAALLQELLSAGAPADVALAAVTAATGMAPPQAAVAAATEAAAASGDETMVAIVEQLAAGAAAAAAAAEDQAASIAASASTASPVQPRQRQQADGDIIPGGQGPAASGEGDSSSRRRRRRASSSSYSGYLPQLCRYLQRHHERQQQQQPSTDATENGADGDKGICSSSSSSSPASLQCTFALHGETFVEQHWYQCYTCGLTESRGCCSTCVRVCHAGHDVVYAARSRFFCDCGGENGPRGKAVPCACLAPVPISTAAATGNTEAAGSSTSANLARAGWLVPAAGDELTLATSLPDPLDAAWSFDPQLYPALFPSNSLSEAGCKGRSSSNSSRDAAASPARSPQQQQQQCPVAVVEQVLRCGSVPWPVDPEAAAKNLLPQGLLAKAARLLGSWLAVDSSSSGKGPDGGQRQQVQEAQHMMQEVIDSTMQLCQLLLAGFRRQRSFRRSSRSNSSSTEAATMQEQQPPWMDPAQPLLPPVLQTKDLIMEGVSSSSARSSKPAAASSSDKSSTRDAVSAPDAGSKGSTACSSNDGRKQQQLLELQRVIRLGNMDNSSSSRSRSSGSDYGGSSSNGNPEVPPEVLAALEGGLVVRRAAAAARQGQLLAVCRGESVGIMDGRLLAAELCGRDIMSKEELVAAAAISSGAMGQQSNSSSSTSSSSSSSSFFYVRRHSAKFHVLGVEWDPLQGQRLLVAGYEQAQVWSINTSDFTVSDRISLQLPAAAAAAEADEAARVVSAASWLPGSDTWVALTTPVKVCLYDLTHPAAQPTVVIQPMGHQLLAGGATWVTRLLLQQPQQEQLGQEGEQQQQVQQVLHAVMLTREGQLLSAALPQQLLDVQQSCAAHWPQVNCTQGPDAVGNSNISSSSAADHTSRSSSRSATPGPSLPGVAAEARQQQQQMGPGSTSQQRAQSGTCGSTRSCVQLTAQPVVWPSSMPQLQHGRSCHFCTATQLLHVAGTAAAAAAPSTAGSPEPDSATADKGGQSKKHQQQLLLQLDATCSSVLQCCRWETHEAVAPLFGSPKPLVLSPAGVFWDLPLLPAARAHYGAPQLLAIAPGQVKQASSSSGTPGQGCAYVAALAPAASAGSGSDGNGIGSCSSSSMDRGWDVPVQPLHLAHSSAGAVVDGLAVLSFPYMQQLLLVVLCSKGNMYLYVTKRPTGLQPMQPFSKLLRQQLLQSPSDKDNPSDSSSSSTGAQHDSTGRSTSSGRPSDAAAATVRDAQHPLCRRAAASSVASGLSPGAAADAEGAAKHPAVPCDSDLFLFEASQNMNNHLSVSGDISRAGTAEAAARALFRTGTDPERRVEAPSTNAGMKLILKIAAGCEIQPVGFKVLLPGGGSAPVSVTLGCADPAAPATRTGTSTTAADSRPSGIAALAAAARSAHRGTGTSSANPNSNSFSRTVKLATSSSGNEGSVDGYSQRWYQVMLRPQESAAAAAAGQLVLQFGAPLDAERRAGVCHLDLFGQPVEAVAERARQEQQEEQQVLPLGSRCLAAAAAVPAVLPPSLAATDDAEAQPAGLSHVLLDTLLQIGTAAASALVEAGKPATEGAGAQSAAESSSSSRSASSSWQVLPVVQQLLSPGVSSATHWSPSWELESSAISLLAASVQQQHTDVSEESVAEQAAAQPRAAAESSAAEGVCSGTSMVAPASRLVAALKLRDQWRLSQAAAILQQLVPSASGATAAAAVGAPLWQDGAVFAFLHAMGLLQSVLQVRPHSVVAFLSQQNCSSHGASSGRSSSNSSSSLPRIVCLGLSAAVFSLKQLSSTSLLPHEVVAPLAKTAVEVCMADAQQQQQEHELEQAEATVVSPAVHDMLILLLNPDEQLRVHAAIALVQACCCCSAASNSDSGVGAAVRLAVVEGVAQQLLQQQGFTARHLLPSYQSIAQVVTALLGNSKQLADKQQLLPAALQVAARVVQVLVQQLEMDHQQRLLQQQAAASSGALGRNAMLAPDAVERLLLLQLLLGHILANAPQQLQKQQQRQHGQASRSEAAVAGANTTEAESVAAAQPAVPTAEQQQQPTQQQLLPRPLLQRLQSALLQTLQEALQLLKEQTGSDSSGSGSVPSHKVSGGGGIPAGPGGFSGYQALLPPTANILRWGLSSQHSSKLFSQPAAALLASSCAKAGTQGKQQQQHSSTNSKQCGAGAWVLDPYIEGGKSGHRLMQGLPLQLAAAAMDLAHTLLRFGLVQAVGQRAAALQPQQPQPEQQAVEASGAVAWCAVLCDVLNVADLRPVKGMAKQLAAHLVGSSSGFKQTSAMHHLRGHAATLLQTLGLPATTGAAAAADNTAAAAQLPAAAAAALQGSWQQQCVVASCLSQLLALAEGQPASWAWVCSGSSNSSQNAVQADAAGLQLLLPLLMQIALQCKAQQLSVTAIKLFNVALTGAVKSSRDSNSSSSSSSKAGSKQGLEGSKSDRSSQSKRQTQASGTAASATASTGCSGSSSSKAHPSDMSLKLDLDWLIPKQQQQQQGSLQAPELLRRFISQCVLGWPEAKERKEAAKTLALLHKVLGAVGASAAQYLLLQTVLQVVPWSGAASGASAVQLCSATGQLLKATGHIGSKEAATSAGRKLWHAVSVAASQLFAAATAAASVLADHPYAVAYQQLQHLMELQLPGGSSSGSVGYWLELSDADVVAGRLHRKPPSTSVRLDSIAAEVKFGDKQVMARLSGWYQVYRVVLLLQNPRRTKAAASLRIWYCDSPVSELQQLKQQHQASSSAAAAGGASPGPTTSSSRAGPVWKLAAADIKLSPGQTEVSVEFELPLLLDCLMLEFTDFHVSLNELAAEVLHCPRCSHVVTDKHGLCGYCRENAFQCRQCRHINYEAPDAFICSECGHSRYGRFEVLLQAVKALEYPPLLAEANWDVALTALDAASEASTRAAAVLHQAAGAVVQQAAALATAAYHHTHDSASSGIGGGSSGDGSSNSFQLRPGLKHLAATYLEQCKPAFDDALKAARAHSAIRAAIRDQAAVEVPQDSSSPDSSSSATAPMEGTASSAAMASAGPRAGAAAAASPDSWREAFSRCTYGHVEAVLNAVLTLLRSMLSVAPMPVAYAARQCQALPCLLALLQPGMGLGGQVAAVSTGAVPSHPVAAEVRNLLLGLAKSETRLHDQLVMLLQQRLLPEQVAAGAAGEPAQQQGQQQDADRTEHGTTAISSSSTRFSQHDSWTGHEVQLLLMIANNDVQQLEKLSKGSPGVSTRATAPRLVLQLLQQVTADASRQALWPELLLLPGLKVMLAAAAAQEQLEKSATARSDSSTPAAAAAAAAAATAVGPGGVPAVGQAAAADAVLDVLQSPPPQQQQPQAAAVVAAAPAVEQLDADDVAQDDAMAEELEQRKIAEYLSRSSSSGTSHHMYHHAHTAPAHLQPRQQQQHTLPNLQSLTPFSSLQQQHQRHLGDTAAAMQQSATPRSASDVPAGLRQHLVAQDAAAAAARLAAAAVAGTGPEQPKPQLTVSGAGGSSSSEPGHIVPLDSLLQLSEKLLLHSNSIAVRKEAAVVLLQLQPSALQRVQRLQLLLPAACLALAKATPGASAAAGTEVFNLLEDAVHEILLESSRGSGSSSISSSKTKGEHHTIHQHHMSGSSPTKPGKMGIGAEAHPSSAKAAGAHAAPAAANSSDAALACVLRSLLEECCQQLVLQVQALLGQEERLGGTGRGHGPDWGAAALPLLMDQIEQLLVGLVQLQQQLQQQHHHHHHHHPHGPAAPEQPAAAAAAAEDTASSSWVDQDCLQQLLWSVGGLDALTAMRTATTKVTGLQLHRLLRQGWLEGGSGSGASGSGGAEVLTGYSGDEDDDYDEDEVTEDDEYDEDEEEDGEEDESSGDHPEGGGEGRRPLLSALPALPQHVLMQRRMQLVEALLQVLATELQHAEQKQQQQQPAAAGAASHNGAQPLAAAVVSWRSSLGVCGALVSLLASAVTPEKPQPSYQLLLEKAATQEEFIPGQLPAGGLVTAAALAAAAAGRSGGGSSGSEIGPLMRDVKNYICMRLDMTGLLDDDFGMELLVGGSIISLALPVMDVVQRHWWPLYQQQQQARNSSNSRARTSSSASAAVGPHTSSSPLPNVPMPVTFRLSGLDGEATEPLVKELIAAQGAGQNAEAENTLVGGLAESQGMGLALLLQLLLLAHQQPLRSLRRVTAQLLELLKAAVERADCRQQLLKQGALGCLLHLVHLACRPLLDAAAAAKHQRRTATRSSDSTAVPKDAGADGGSALGCGITGAQLLKLLECIDELVTEANSTGRPVLLGAAAAEAAQQQQQQQQELLRAASSSSVSNSSSLAAQHICSSSTEVAQLADGLSVLEMAGLGNCAAVLARLLTALARHSGTAQLGLIKHFAPALDLQALDDAAAESAGKADSTTASAAAAGTVPAAAADASNSEAVLPADADAEAGAEDDALPLLASVSHAEADGGMSAQEQRLQVRGFLRLVEALSSTSNRKGVVPSASSDTAAEAGVAAVGGASAGVQQGAERQQVPTADFKHLALEEGIPMSLAAYLLGCFTVSSSQPSQLAPRQASSAPPAGPAAAAGPSGTEVVPGGTAGELLQPGTLAWLAAASRPGVPLALQILTALATQHAATAAALGGQQPQLLPLLHLLEGTAGGSTITPLAEACLEALAASGAGSVADAIAALRAATAAEMKAKAAKKREALLASLGMVQVEARPEAGGGVKILPSPGGVPALSPLAAELAALEGAAAEDDEAGGVCMVCREGYGFQPSSLLGCYCYCRVAAASEWPGCAAPWGTPYDLIFTTVSHFNLIHVNCHAAAKAADASLRQPKREWQGATLRNGNVLCNCLLPLAAPAAGKADTAYAAAVSSFWQQQLAAPSSREAAAAAGSGSSGGGAAVGSDGGAVAVTVSLSRRSNALREADNSLLRVSLAAADMATLLWRFAAQLSFSEEARGGGRASNARLLLALLQLGRYFVEEAPTGELRDAQQLVQAATGVAAALGLERSSGTTTSGSSGTGSSNKASGSSDPVCSKEDLTELTSCAPFVLALSMLLMGPTEWMSVRRSMLTMAVRFAVSRALDRAAAAVTGTDSGTSSSHRRSSSSGTSAPPATAAASSNAAGLSDGALYEATSPMLRLFGMVDWLHQWAKPAVGLAPAGSSGSSSSSSAGSSSPWAAAMAKQLQDLRGCSEAATELLEVVDEAESALGLQDLLDGLGLLGVVLGPGCNSCEEFLRQVAGALN